MTIFGIRIMTEKAYQAELDRVTDECAALLAINSETIETWRAKYFYAKARAITAERFRDPVVKVWPVPFGVDSGVRIEVGVNPAAEDL